ncbi:metallophosphoesterase family protein [Halosimplex pelagicum]|uniref:Phosphoesterase n=1 Tax=Halosimplex pelagicum TaxID=869886 RepID=A0A7D5P8Z8_9EURY|nr:metallophosphoesterase family protein [Halosimplex pelagicum]QLH80402.1 metallophosphoesterase family protein [Halosimplex pelagicum]
MELAVISDTHIPSRASRIPEAFRERIRSADHVVHAGDFDSEGTLADVRDLAPELTAVAGNTDPRVGLPERVTVEFGGVTFVVLHGTGSKRGWADRVAAAVREEADEPRVGVAGHTHKVFDEEIGGARVLNPGSATGAAPADRATMLTVEAADGEIDVTVHEA